MPATPRQIRNQNPVIAWITVPVAAIASAGQMPRRRNTASAATPRANATVRGWKYPSSVLTLVTARRGGSSAPR